MATTHEPANDNLPPRIDVICSNCGGLTEPRAAGIEPICLACLLNEDLHCELCDERARGQCAICGDKVCAGPACLAVHLHEEPGCA
jgi:hypothetical protein